MMCMTSSMTANAHGPGGFAAPSGVMSPQIRLTNFATVSSVAAQAMLHFLYHPQHDISSWFYVFTHLLYFGFMTEVQNHIIRCYFVDPYLSWILDMFKEWRYTAILIRKSWILETLLDWSLHAVKCNSANKSKLIIVVKKICICLHMAAL